MKQSTQRVVLAGVLAAVLGAAVSGCAPAVLGGVVIGSMVALDRRTSGSQLEDEGIEIRSASRIREHLGDRVHVNIASYNRQVLITGEVPNAQDRQQVELIVSKVDNVRAIVNELAVLGNTSFTQRSSDTLITGRVKAGMIDAKDLFVGAFKVVTERGVTYLMGRVSQREANRASDIARSTTGVQKVVRILEIISEEELQRLLPASAAQQPTK
ncbi:BON domain-containing protein [Rhodoferax sp.]|uniref:BON domain-containing protein n=1 Tax=Rhodoferax sp. TaxID=50421 RepID=UPI0027470D8D|nr:BON domain-containing protein [Rhodoferax sp.]